MLIKIFDPRIEDVLQTILPKVLYREDAVGLANSFSYYIQIARN